MTNNRPKKNPKPIGPYDPPYTIHGMTEQNFPPDYLPNNSIYKSKAEAEEEEGEGGLPKGK